MARDRPSPYGNRVDGISSVGQDRLILTHSESGDSELRLGEKLNRSGGMIKKRLLSFPNS